MTQTDPLHFRLRNTLSICHVVFRYLHGYGHASFNYRTSSNEHAMPWMSSTYHQPRWCQLGPLADPGGGAMPPLAAWASTQNALKVAIFRLKIENIFWGGAMPPPQTPASFPLHKFNHNVVSNTLVLSPRAICIHTTASFLTSNGFLRLKRFKQFNSVWENEQWTIRIATRMH